MDTLVCIRAFINVVDAEGFSAAARKLGRSKALLSKYVRELEDSLGALLINRTTRQFSLTEAGQIYYQTASDIVQEIDSLADLVRENNKTIKGKLRISLPRTFIDADIGESIIDFVKKYPDITLKIRAEDRFVDLIEEGFDVAIRITKLEDSGLIARKLADFTGNFCVTPEFLARYGPITHPHDLAHIPCIIDTNGLSYNNWRFVSPQGEQIIVAVNGPIEVNSPISAMRAAKAGLGLAMVPDFIGKCHLACGDLIRVLDDYVPKDRGIYAVYPHKRHLPAKVRIFVDHLHAWLKNS